MKKLKLWATAFLVFPCLGAMGENVYVYNDAAGEPVQAFTDIRKITFTEDAMHVMAANGTSTEVLFADFNYFTFVEKENSGIGTIASGAVVFLDKGNNLSITSDNVISGYNLPPSLQTAEATYSSFVPNASAEGGDYESLVSSFEKELIVEALKLKKGNASAAAKHLGTTQRVVLYKIKKLGIDTSLYK